MTNENENKKANGIHLDWMYQMSLEWNKLIELKSSRVIKIKTATANRSREKIMSFYKKNIGRKYIEADCIWFTISVLFLFIFLFHDKTTRTPWSPDRIKQ